MNNNLLKSFLRCKRKAWLEFQGDKSKSIWNAHNAIQLITQDDNFDKYVNGKIFSGLRSCKEGRISIRNLFLDINLNGRNGAKINPPLLLKVKGNSIWGAYKYVPAVSKLGKKTTNEHRLDLAFCAIHLEKLQESSIDYGLVISNFKNNLKSEKVLLDYKLKQKAKSTFEELLNTLNESIPQITKNRKKCSICCWQKYCDEEAKSKGLLTDIDGIGFKTEEALKKAGINNFKQLARCDHDELNNKLSIFQEANPYRTSKFINQSKSYVSGIPLRVIKDNPSLLNFYQKIKKGFFIFDIESHPDEGHDYLYGFLSIKNIDESVDEKYYESILDLNPYNNKNILENLFKKINSQEGWPIFHYGETEKVSIIRIAKELNLTPLEIEKLKSRLIDLHSLLRLSWILPLKNYSLKTVANWMGFNWNQENVSGSQALLWWIQYQNTSNKSFLTKIVRYNMDDCLATLSIIRWLKSNYKKKSKEN